MKDTSRDTSSAMMNRSRMLRRITVHGLRVLVLAAIVGLIRIEHKQYVMQQEAVDLTAIPLSEIQQFIPEAMSLGEKSSEVIGGYIVRDERNRSVGTIFQTSPAGDSAIGFSGSTNILIVCDDNLCIVGLEILSSGDTRDHVRAVRQDDSFFQSFVGKKLDDVAAVQTAESVAVAGATLTSFAITEALVLRAGGNHQAGVFSSQPVLSDLRFLFPQAEQILFDEGDPSVIRVRGKEDIPLGWALRTSPVADGVIGYQGPTDALVGFDGAGRVCGVVVQKSFDNEPYVGYVRDDRAFRGVYRGMTIEELGGLDPENTGVEGVSGSTMTSQAIAEGIVRAARSRETSQAGMYEVFVGVLRGIEAPQWGALCVIVVGILTGITRLRGTWFGRFALPVVVFVYLGFGAGALLSQSQIWGWAQAGIPQNAVVLLVLAVAAAVLPITIRRNVYCSQLCAHGALQQLILRVVKPKGRVPVWIRPWLKVFPLSLLVLAILLTVFHMPISLVDLEPFDAYLPMVAGGVALSLFGVSVLASFKIPMAYCQYGCPTGLLLDHLRYNGRAEHLTWRDAVLACCLLVAMAVQWWPV